MTAETNTNRKEVIQENSTRIDCDFNIGDKILVRKKQAYKYKIFFKVRMKFFKYGRIELSLYERARSQLD